MWKNEVNAAYNCCPNGFCENTVECNWENYINCPADCPAPPSTGPLPSGASTGPGYCGDRTCDPGLGEVCDSCISDCGVCAPPGWVECGIGTCANGVEFKTICTPSCTAVGQSCFNTPDCNWPPPNCTSPIVGYCPAPGGWCPCAGAGCPGGGSCGVIRCAGGGNCWSDCSGCTASPLPGASDQPPPSEPPCTPVVPVAPGLTSPANGSEIHTAMVTLDWENTVSWGQSCPDQPDQYRVYMDTVNPPATKVCTTSPGTTSCDAAITSINTFHYWRVCTDNSSFVVCSSVWSFTPTNVKPNPATGGSPQGNLTTNTLSFTWDHDGVWGTNINTSNVVLNYSFENADNFWGFYGGMNNVGNSFSIDSTIAKLHSNSLKLNVVAQGGGITPYAVMSQSISSLAGKTIHIGGWLKSDGSATAYLGYKNDTDNIVQFVGSGVISTSWTYVEGTAVLQLGKNYSVRLQSSNPGSSWFDYITVVEDQSANQYFYVDYSTTSGSYNWASPKCSVVGNLLGSYSCGPFGPGSTPPINWGTTYYWKVRASNNANNFSDTNTYNDSSEWSFTPQHGPWFQVYGGDVYGSIISSEIPQTSCSGTCKPYFMPTPASQKHGVVVYNNTFSLGTDCSGACIPGNVSEDTDDWYVQTDINTTEYNYDWWVSHLREEAKVAGDFNGNNPNVSGIYVSADSVTTSGNWNIPNRQVIILINGDFNINNKISVGNTGFLMVVASGSITIDSTLNGGNANNPAVEGIFMADNINIPSQGHVPSDDSHLFTAGSLIGWTSINLQRNIGTANNGIEPSMTFSFRPDFIINAPDAVKKIYLPRWEQVPG